MPDETELEPRHDRPPSGDVVAPLPPGLRPACVAHEGRYARLEPLEPRAHAAELYAASHAGETARQLWRYLPNGPYESEASFERWLRDCAASADPLFFAVRDLRTNRAGGMVSYLNIAPQPSSIELGHIWFGPAMQNTRASTEALYLLLRHALDDLGYRRAEWKCDALNAASRRAAVRLGFAFEGIFYQHRVVKGRNRDTAWFALLDGEWPPLRENFEIWLAPDNFDAAGRQRLSLGALNRATREQMAGNGGR